MSTSKNHGFSVEYINQSDLKQKLKKYIRNWYLFLISLTVFLSLAYLYLWYATPLYSINSTILIKDDKRGGETLDAADAFADLNILKKSQNLNNEVILFKGKALMALVMEELDLNVSYFTEGKVKTIELYEKTSPIKVIVSHLDTVGFGKLIKVSLSDTDKFELNDDLGSSTETYGTLIKKPYATFTIIKTGNKLPHSEEVEVQFNDLYSVASKYSGKVNLTPIDRDASVLNVSLIDPVPHKGEAIINKLIEVYNRENIADKNEVSQNIVRFIDERLAGLVNDLTAVEANVEQYKRKNHITNVGVEAQNFVQETSAYNRELNNFETQISVLESLQSYLGSSNSHELVPGSMGIQDPALIGLTSKYNELQLERQRLLRTQKEANPLVKGIDEQLFNLRSNIGENLDNIKTSLLINRNSLAANTGRSRARVSNVPTIERNLLEIQRQQGIKESLYSYLLQKREESAITLAAAVTNTRVIDVARASKYPVSPRSMLVYMSGAFFGLLLPVILFSIKDSLNERIETATDVQKITDVPFLGEITHNTSKEALVVKNGSRNEIAEIFRLIRSNIKYAFNNKRKQVILVTSSMEKEGKTFISINIGASFAITGKKVIILEFDLRAPKLLDSLNIPTSDKGINNYITDSITQLQDIVIQVEDTPNLFVIPAGTLPNNPSELLLSDRIAHLFNELRQQYDYIIIDSAPVGQVADSFSFQEFTDMVIYVVRYNYTFKQQINIINDIELNARFENMMVLLNDAKKHNGYGYGYGYGNGYGYGE